MLSKRISSWRACSACAWVPDPYAQRVHKGRSMRVRNSIFSTIFKVPKTAKILKNRYWHQHMVSKASQKKNFFVQTQKKSLLKTRLSIRIRNWCVRSACASFPDAYAQQTHKFLTRMLRVRISPWCVCSACFEGTALLKIRLSIRVRNFAAPNEPLNIFFYFFYFNPKVAIP